eukprot:746962-Hanusia_phi.AAC.12
MGHSHAIDGGSSGSRKRLASSRARVSTRGAGRECIVSVSTEAGGNSYGPCSLEYDLMNQVSGLVERLSTLDAITRNFTANKASSSKNVMDIVENLKVYMAVASLAPIV